MFMRSSKLIILRAPFRALGKFAVPVLCLSGILCACGPGPVAQANGVTLRILRPTQDQVLTNHSLAAQVEVDGPGQYSLRYYLDGADRGAGDTSFTLTDITPGSHRVEVQALDDQGRPVGGLRAGVDFTVQ